jgi:predicted  nucleic acid-binding Zn-ribbon protein
MKMMDVLANKISREQIELLIALQQKEQIVSKMELGLSQVPKKLADIDANVKTIEAAIIEKKENLETLKKDYRARDAEIQTNQNRIAKRQEQLRSVTTNKEYQAILKEIEEIKKVISRMEDETLACLDQIDAAEKEIMADEETLAAEKAEADQQKKDISGEADAERDSLSALLAERREIVSRIDQALFGHYEDIKSHSRGIAIVEVRESVCMGCHMNIPPQMYNELHRENEIKICPHCHRLLYVLQ